MRSSIHSLLKNVKNKISIHILHSTPSTFEKYLERLYKHKNCKEIILYPVNSERRKFPNLNNSHVSSATYFRLFLEDFLNEKEEIIYLDADTIVLNDPTDLIITKFLTCSRVYIILALLLKLIKNYHKTF